MTTAINGEQAVIARSMGYLTQWTEWILGEKLHFYKSTLESGWWWPSIAVKLLIPAIRQAHHCGVLFWMIESWGTSIYTYSIVKNEREIECVLGAIADYFYSR